MITQLEERFRALGTVLGLTKYKVRRGKWTEELYLYDRHALQLEIDRRENALFLYGVRLRDGRLPGPEVVYRYPDGQLCRTFLEEIYHAKRPAPGARREQYTEAYLLACFDFYENLIRSDPDILRRYFDTMDERI